MQRNLIFALGKEPEDGYYLSLSNDIGRRFPIRTGKAIWGRALVEDFPSKTVKMPCAYSYEHTRRIPVNYRYLHATVPEDDRMAHKADVINAYDYYGNYKRRPFFEWPQCRIEKIIERDEDEPKCLLMDVDFTPIGKVVCPWICLRTTVKNILKLPRIFKFLEKALAERGIDIIDFTGKPEEKQEELFCNDCYYFRFLELSTYCCHPVAFKRVNRSKACGMFIKRDFKGSREHKILPIETAFKRLKEEAIP